MEAKKRDLVWYICYGSNIDTDRFLKYLKGGTLPTIGKVTRTYSPCPHGTQDPVKSKPYILNQKLFFALESQKTWGGTWCRFY